VPVSRDSFKPLHNDLATHRAVLARNNVARRDDADFLADNGEPLTQRGVSMLFKRLKKRAGIEGKRVPVHNYQQYMATTQLANGRSPLDVRRQLGHSTLKMTDHYASLSIQQLQKSHEQHSPLRAKGDAKNEAFGTGYWDE
jgi:site-specific recombinase XerD